MMRFERFTKSSQDVFARAYAVQQRYGHNEVDTEHILLALLKETDGVVTQVLAQLKVDANALRDAINEILQARPKRVTHTAGEIFITVRANQIISFAAEEANRLKDDSVGPKHIFLAILREQNTAVHSLMGKNGITTDKVNEAMNGTSSEGQSQS